jgi:hypothetical protein
VRDKLVKIAVEVEPSKILDWILDIYITHKCSWELILAILGLVNKITKKKILPQTKYKFFKKFNKSVEPIFHLYCDSCNKLAYEYTKTKTVEYKCFFCDNIAKVINCRIRISDL